MNYGQKQHQVLAGIAKILVDCIDPSVPWMEDFLTQLCDEDGITDDEKSSLQDHLTDIAIQDVMKQAIELAGNKNGGFEILERVLVIDEDLALRLSEEAKKVSELLLRNWNDEILAGLILIWDELRQNENHATSIASEIWTESHAISQGDWPRDFMCFCLGYSERDKVARFVSSFSLETNTNFNKEQATLFTIKDCFSEIFTRCLDSQMMITLIVKLRGKGALTKEQKKSLIDTAKSDDTEDAASTMIDLIDKTDHGFQYFSDIFQEKGNIFAEEVVDMVVHMGKHGLESQQMKLILLWTELINHSEIIRRWIVELWPDLPGLVDTKWPLNFIAFCITGTSDDVEKVGMLVNEISEVAKNQQISSEHSVNQETYRKTDSMAEGEDASFVIVSEDECTDDDTGRVQQPDGAKQEPRIPPNQNKQTAADISRLASNCEKEIDRGDDDGDVQLKKRNIDELVENRSLETKGTGSNLDTEPSMDTGIDQAYENVGALELDHSVTNFTLSSEDREELACHPTLPDEEKNGDNPGNVERAVAITQHENEIMMEDLSWQSSADTDDSNSHSNPNQAKELENQRSQINRRNHGDETLTNTGRQMDGATKPHSVKATEYSSGEVDSGVETLANTEKHTKETYQTNFEEVIENPSSPVDKLNNGDRTAANTEKQIEVTPRPHFEEVTGDGTPKTEDSTDEEFDDACSLLSAANSNDHSDIESDRDMEYLTPPDGSVNVCEGSVPAIGEEGIGGPEKQHVNVDEDVVLTQSEEDVNTNTDGQPMSVEFRVFVKEKNWISEGWQPYVLLYDEAILKRMRYNKMEEYYYCRIPVHVDVHGLYYIYRLYKSEGTGNMYSYISEFLPEKCPCRFIVIAQGEKQTTLDIATFNSNKSTAGWNSLMGSWFNRFLPDVANHEKTTRHAYEQIQAWFEVAYLGWQFDTPENKSHVVKLPTEKIEKITNTWLRRLMKSEERIMITTCCMFVVVAMAKQNRTVESRDLLKAVHSGLRIQSLDGATLEELIKDVILLIGQTELTDCMERFLKKCIESEDVSLILTLPLYQSILSGGKVCPVRLEIYTPGILEDRALLYEKLDWNQFRKSILGNTNKQNELLALRGSILTLSNAYPNIVDTYHYFLSLRSLIKLIKHKELAAKFQIDSIFSQILPFFKADNKQSLKLIMSKVTPYLFERFNAHREAVANADDNQGAASVKKAVYLLEFIVDEITWYSKNAMNLTNLRRECFNWLLSMASCCFRWLHALNYDHGNLNKSHDGIVQSATRFICNDYKYSKESDAKQLEFYNAQFSQDWYYDQFQSSWRDHISFEVGTCINERWSGVDNDGYLVFYIKFVQKNAQKGFHNIMDRILENIASDHLLEVIKATGDRAGSKLSTLLGHFCKLGIFNPVAGAVEKVLLKYWDDDPTMRSLKFLADSEMAPVLYQEFGQENLSTLMKSAASTNLQRLNDETHSIFEKLRQKKIKLKEMKFILQHKTRIIELLSSIESRKRAADADQAPLTLEIKLLMESSEKISKSYRERCAAIRSFVEFCQSLRENDIIVNCRDFTSLTREDENISLEEAERKNVEDSATKEMRLILLIRKCKMLVRVRGHIAKEYYTNAQKTSPQEKVMIKWEKALSIIWRNVARRLNDLMAKLQDGSLGNKEISCEFKDFKENPQELEGELNLLTSFYESSNASECGHVTKTPSELAAAISYVFTRERQEKVIKWMVEFTTKHDISGDFGILDEKNLLQRDLAEISKLQDISEISPIEIKILEGFSKEEDLIEWLQSYPNGKEGLEALCLVAVEASRFNMPLADRWSMLKESIMTFGDLLFAISDISSIDHLIARCKCVFRNVDYGNEMMKKWLDTGKELSWYKENAGKHGSEEVAALEFAGRAIKSGTYVIGKPSGASVPTLAESIHMIFDQTDQAKSHYSKKENIDSDAQPKAKDEDTKDQQSEKENIKTDVLLEDKEIRLEKLHQYESILTLITNEGQESECVIKQYIETLTAVERLAKAYVNLINAGFILFNGWKMKISCSSATSDDVTSEKILTTWMTFIDGAGNLGGRACIKDINQLSDEMNKALFKWRNHVSDMRLKHYHLNEYSIQQIRYLCESLGKSHQHTFDDQVYLLLSNAPRQSLITHIRDSLDEALTFAIDEDVAFELPQEDHHLSQDEIENRKKQQAVRYLVMTERISEKLAKAAVQAEAHDRLPDCVNWVVLNEYNEEEVTKRCREFDRAIEFVHGDEGVHEDATVSRDSSVTSVAGMIAHLQSRANQVDITSAVKTVITGYLTGTTGAAMKDHLSVHHLGIFLSILRRKLGEIPTPRFLGYPFHRGAPNLIITEKEAAIPTALSLYCSDTESQLPNSKEVLLCSESTTEDEVERFLLRAMCRYSDSQKKHISEEKTAKMRDLVDHLMKNENMSNKLAKAAVQANGYVDVANCINWAKLHDKEENEVNALSDDFDRTTSAGPIFCIISLENLQFNVWTALDKKYEILAKSNHNDRYQLVLISSSGNHHAALPFIKYQLAETPVVNLKAIRSFVEREMSRDGIPNQPNAKVITSDKAGMGKSLHVARLCEKLPQKCKRTTVRLLDSAISMKAVIHRLTRNQATEDPKLIHIDISQAVENDLEKFVFDLLILGLIKDNAGNVWRRRQNHSYVIEVTKCGSLKEMSRTLDLLPTLIAISPKEVLERLKGGPRKPEELLIDAKEHQSRAFQRTVHYLKLNKNNSDMSKFTYHKKLEATHEKESIEILLAECGIPNPTWAQLKHFISFLNVLLMNCEKSNFLRADVDWLKGFKELSVKFMIKMAKNFATPSLVIADESSTRNGAEVTPGIDDYQVRRKWEEQDQSYIFFNDDVNSMTFINVNVDDDGNLLDENGKVLKEGITNPGLIRTLKDQRLPFGFQFQKYDRGKKLKYLGDIMGITKVKDPDQSYELTTDNVLKMITIYLRLRCGIPVIIMGETGCGKTRMIEYLSKLLKLKDDQKRSLNGNTKTIAKDGEEPKKDKAEKNGSANRNPTSIADDKEKAENENEAKNEEKKSANVNSNIPMRTVKVHGGIQASDIQNSVQQSLNDGKSVLFFDEANTTTAIYAIKEVMCDLSIDGDIFHANSLSEIEPAAKNTEQLEIVSEEQPEEDLITESKCPPIQVIAACNPYKKLSNEALSNLEKSGLGYRIPKDATVEKFGNMAMRTLVYRVVALPQSIQPFVWDFGELSKETELIYIGNMMSKALEKWKVLIPSFEREEKDLIVEMLSEIQCYIRTRDDEYRYVSLRDVERTIILLEWFLKHYDNIFPKVDKELEQNPGISKLIRCFIHAIGISYHVSLNNRCGLRVQMSHVLSKYGIDFNPDQIATEYEKCQQIFQRDLKVAGDHIAWNEALRENVFLMAVCADAKLPLYIIGKPGSSKSLAKSTIEINMKGKASSSKIFQSLTKVEMHSFQCSAQTNTAGIEGVFQLAAYWQNKPHKERLTSLVVLDEIGLAEDSPNMPLKIPHPLLECGNAKTGTLTDYDPADKVAFVGISNWALDPAKMNRGIFVTRNTPVEDDLFNTAGAICEGKANDNYSNLYRLIATYLNVYKSQDDHFFGLRDFYSMIKMFHSATKNNRDLKPEYLAYILRRNFSGGSKQHDDIVKSAINQEMGIDMSAISDSYDVSTIIKESVESAQCSSRFLLLLTKHYSAIHLLNYILPDFQEDAHILFGSSFPGDHTYNELCKAIKKVKACIEQGKKVVSLNMADIHESLYDVLNQHYLKVGTQNYVAVGLGTHRVWTRVHPNFRMIFVEKEEVARTSYPIPLLNRLEKHHISTSGLLNDNQNQKHRLLSEWVNKYSTITKQFPDASEFTSMNSFLGFNGDTIGSVILMCPETDGDNIEEHKDAMLQLATPDSVFRLPKTDHSEIENSTRRYMKEQIHDSLFSLLKHTMETNAKKAPLIQIFEVASYSSILTEGMRKDLELNLRLPKDSVMLVSLQLFKVMVEFTRSIEQFFKRSRELAEAQKRDGTSTTENTAILLIQSSQAHKWGQLIECVKYQFNNKRKEERVAGCNMIVVFILSTERTKSSLCLQPTRAYKTIYIDELGYTKSNTCTTLITSFFQKSLVDILKEGENSGQEDNFVHCILQDCIVDAVSQLNDAVNMNGHQADRIRTLREITSGNASNDPKLSHVFLRILFHSFQDICRAFSTPDEIENWVCNEALSKKRLQEGGTFGKTIHLRLKREVSRILAMVIKVIDENGNMNILTRRQSEMTWKCELWMKVFESCQFHKSLQSKIAYSEVALHIGQSKTPCRFPFSTRLTKALYAMYLDAVNGSREETEDFFYNQINTNREKEISEILQAWNRSTDPREKQDMMKSYTYDLVSTYFSHLNMNRKECEAISDILHGFVMKQWYACRDKNGFGLTFFLFMKLEKQFKIILQILVIYPEIKDQLPEWIAKQEHQNSFKGLTYALQSFLDEANKRVTAISDEDSCMEWMSTSALIRDTYDRSLPMIDSEEKNDLIEKWKPLGLHDILLMRLLPWNVQDPDRIRYLKIVVDQATRLLKSTKAKGFHSMDVLQIVTSISRKAYEQLKFNLTINWQHPALCSCGREFDKAYQMPCSRFVCEKCATNADKNTRICPACYITFDDQFKIRTAELSADQTKKLEAFKANCTGFFLMYLRDYCFSDEGDEELELKVKAIFQSTIYTNGKTATSGKLRLQTNQLDLNIATQSIILGFLKARQPEIYIHDLNEIIRSNNVDHDLIATVLRTLEAEYSETLSDQNIPNKMADDVRSKWRLIRQNKQLNVYALHNVAVIRFALTEFVTIIDQEAAGNDIGNDTSSLILRVQDMCKGDDTAILKQFVVQEGLVYYGTKWFHLVTNCRHLEAFAVVTPQQDTLQKMKLELWTAFGDEYRNCIEEIDKGNATLEFPNTMRKDYIAKVLAIVQRKPPGLMRQIKSNMKPEWAYLIRMSDKLERNIHGIAGFTIRQKHEAFKLVTSAVSVVLSGIPLVDQLKSILKNPVGSKDRFWPAMPRSLYHKFNSVMTEEVPYRCRNGHVYYIGDCTYPWVKSKCPECGCDIGGVRHMAARGNERLESSEPSGKCYQLHVNVKGAELPGNRVTQQAAEVMQFFIHSCMIVALLSEGTSPEIIRILGKRRTQYTESLKFLMQKLWDNLRGMSKYLGCTVDDGVLLLQKIIVKMSCWDNTDVENTSWDSEDNCDEWEQKFRELYLCSIFREADDIILEAKNEMNTDEAWNGAAQGDLNETFTYENSALWQPLKHATTEHLMHSIIDSPESGAVLKAILTTPDLQHVMKLKDLLKLQEILISMYENTHDMKDVEKITFSKLRGGGEKKEELTRLIKQFIDLWNQMYPTLLAKNSDDLVLQNNMREISAESPITIAIPHIRGKGRCAKLLTEYLINTQNNLLERCVIQDDTILEVEKVPVSKLQDSHFVCIDKQKDLLPIIRLHTSYRKIQTPCGIHHRITYNIPALEKQVKQEHVIYKKRILKESLPCIRYADTGIGQDWDILKESIPQEKLPPPAWQALNELVGKTTLAEICEGVRTLTQAICLLAKLKTAERDGSRKLCDYLQKDLMLKAHHLTMIPRSTQIIHTLALYQKLTWHRAVRFVQQGLDPYKEYFPKDNQEDIVDHGMLQGLKSCFESTDVGALQERINEMLLKTDISYFKPEWSLKYILPELEYLQDEDNHPFLYENLPEEVQFKHVSHLFRLSVDGISDLENNLA